VTRESGLDERLNGTGRVGLPWPSLLPAATSAYSRCMAEFVTVARVGDVPANSGCQVTVDGHWIALFNVDGSYYAVEGTCLHRGGPLADGAIRQSVVTCPWHGWQFDVRTGVLVQDPSLGVACYPTRVVGEDIQVQVGER
jgi:nitrite reductase (NADH) small subunit/3-phenylpropionate/trans-cinnamate dioxygenase ferredoxin subunit